MTLLTAQAAAKQAQAAEFDIQGHAPAITQGASLPPMEELTEAKREVAYHLDLAARLRAAATDLNEQYAGDDVTVAKSLLLEAAKHLEEGAYATPRVHVTGSAVTVTDGTV